ncbi:unnamed protein product [Somion occarium]|uniref:Uncharacterized protein n=1 Tax=Somion occarium TaxID=3059160 RepID=A0ABP1EBC2_9APHY
MRGSMAQRRPLLVPFPTPSWKSTLPLLGTSLTLQWLTFVKLCFFVTRVLVFATPHSHPISLLLFLVFDMSLLLHFQLIFLHNVHPHNLLQLMEPHRDTIQKHTKNAVSGLKSSCVSGYDWHEATCTNAPRLPPREDHNARRNIPTKRLNKPGAILAAFNAVSLANGLKAHERSTYIVLSISISAKLRSSTMNVLVAVATEPGTRMRKLDPPCRSQN